MNFTVADYDNALKGFLDAVEPMKRDIISVLLFGSMARGDVRPGHSDVLDAFVFFDPMVFKDRERFLRNLEIMVTACDWLAQTGLDYHPFVYWENVDLISAAFLAPCRSLGCSQIVFGKEMRHTVDASPASRFLAGKMFFAVRRYGHRLVYLLSKPELTARDLARITEELARAQKTVPLLACFTMGIWPGEADVIREFRQALPELDISVIDKVKTLRHQKDSPDPESLRQLLREMLDFVEALHDRLIVKLTEVGTLLPDGAIGDQSHHLIA
jgi:predicted nucleotidyltransferase